MIRLPELSPEERTYLQSMLPSNDLQALAERLRQGLIVNLGGAVSVSCLPCETVHALPEGNEPVIKIEKELAAAWLAIRYGGKAGVKAWPIHDAGLFSPLTALVRRALAQTVVNLGEGVAWPQSLRLQVRIGPQQGIVEIYWNSDRAVFWAHRAIRENA